MNKKNTIQLLLILLLLFSSFFFYNEYNKKNTIVNINKDKIKNEESEINKSEGEYNLLKNIKYISKDSSNNIYEIYAEEGRIDSENPDVTLMKNVKAYIFLNKENREDVIEIISKYATYNSLNYNTFFRDNILVNYFSHKITCEKLDISFESNIASFYENLVYENEQMKMDADKLEIDLISKNSNIIMFDTEKKISIVNKN